MVLSCEQALVNTQIMRSFSSSPITLPGNCSLQLANLVNPNGFHYTNNAGDHAIITYNVITDISFGTLKTGDGRSFCLEKCNDMYAWMEFDTTVFKPDKAVELDKQDEDLEGVRRKNRNYLVTTNFAQYSVMFYYTKQFAETTQDIPGFIDQILAETNQGYVNSGVPLEVTKHCIEAADIDEVEDSLKMLEAFRYMKKTIKRLRHSADAAILLTEHMRNSCGIAFLNQVTTGYTLSVVHKSCALGYFSIGHELGHNMGLHHNPEVTTNSYYPHGHGHLIDQGVGNTGYRTILAYSTPGHQTRVNYYSNPDVSYTITGTRTGVEGVSNNAQLLRQNMKMMAGIGDESLACRIPSKNQDTISYYLLLFSM